MIVFDEHFKKPLQELAKELHDRARGKIRHFPTEVMAKLLDGLAAIESPFCDLDRCCFFLVKDAYKELGEIYFTPDEALEVVENEKNKDNESNSGKRGDLCHED